MNINDVIEVLIVDIDNNGNGIAKYNNIVIFIKGVLLNELVKIRIIDIKKRYVIGELIEVIEKSSSRCGVLCPYFYECGGCDFLHINVDEEIKLKENHVKGLFPDVEIDEVISLEPINYRNKVSLHVIDGKIGFYKKSSNELIEINKCLLVDNEINKIIDILNNYDLSLVNGIMIRKSNDNDIMIKLSGKLSDHDLMDLLKLENLSSLYFDDTLIYNNMYLTEDINNIKYTIYPNAFFQVNKNGMIKLYDKIKEYAGSGERLLDLYCGTGTIGIYLKDNYKYILGVEENKDAIKNAKINKKINKLDNIDFICGDASIVVKDKFDTIIVDPPRSGLSKKVINNLLNSGVKRIVYVSCNPDTLKQNIDDLSSKYEIIKFSIVNMFVRTKHLECVVLLELK